MESFSFTRDHAGIADDIIERYVASLSDYRAHLRDVVAHGNYTNDESSINLPADEALLHNVEVVAKDKGGDNLRYIIVVGIGGSSLGTRAVSEALWKKNTPKFIFLDTVSAVNIEWALGILKQLDKSEYIICVVSKSGTTVETVVNSKELTDTLGNERVARIGGVDADLTIPELVGGRYSVLSAVGLLPLMLAGVDVNALRNGARDMVELCLVDESPALTSAVIQFAHYEAGLKINNSFFFDPRLEHVGKWYRQLMGESLGKDGKGVTPIVSIGSTDLHSVGQLYIGGPKDKMTTLVSVGGAHDIMTAIYNRTRETYIKNELPFVEVGLLQLDAYAVGAFLQFKMIEIMYLAKLMGVNAFDQPDVEQFKEEIKKLLATSH